MPDDTPSRDPPRKPRGRPRLVHGGDAVSVSTTVAPLVADRLYRLASQRGTTVSSLLRSWLTREGKLPEK
jgi:hypothetical protein